MTSPAEGIGAILENLGVTAGSSGWTTRYGDSGDVTKAVTLYDTGGRGGEVKVAIDYPSVQAIVYGSPTAGGYTEAYAKAKEIYDKMMGIPTPHAAWAQLVSCVMVNEPVWLGRDDKERPRFSLNFRLITTPENAGNRNY